jgi:hypothetical protein
MRKVPSISGYVGNLGKYIKTHEISADILHCQWKLKNFIAIAEFPNQCHSFSTHLYIHKKYFKYILYILK